MAAAFIEVTDRNVATFKLVINTDHIVSVVDDGTGAVIVYHNPAQSGKGFKEYKVVETYAVIKTALGL